VAPEERNAARACGRREAGSRLAVCRTGVERVVIGGRVPPRRDPDAPEGLAARSAHLRARRRGGARELRGGGQGVEGGVEGLQRGRVPVGGHGDGDGQGAHGAAGRGAMGLRAPGGGQGESACQRGAAVQRGGHTRPPPSGGSPAFNHECARVGPQARLWRLARPPAPRRGCRRCGRRAGPPPRGWRGCAAGVAECVGLGDADAPDRARAARWRGACGRFRCERAAAGPQVGGGRLGPR